MPTDLSQHIQATPLMDTHEHLHQEATFVENGPDVLRDLFDNYLAAELVVAGATREAVLRLIDSNDPDIEARWSGVSDFWSHCQYTGYGRATAHIARHIYGMEEITLDSIHAATERNMQMRQPGERLRILKEDGNLDHVQVDDFTWACVPDASGLDFFLYDLSWAGFCRSEIDKEALQKEVAVDVVNLDTLREAMTALFTKYAACAIAVKAQHAYYRTLFWQKRDDADAERVLQKQLTGEELSEAERLCLGDWWLGTRG